VNKLFHTYVFYREQIILIHEQYIYTVNKLVYKRMEK
jgi:hypothetical protein